MHYKIWYDKLLYEDGTQSTKSLIEFRVTSSMFRNGRLNLRCTASISNVYQKSAEIEITEDVPRIASITGESPPYDHRKYPTNWLRHSIHVCYSGLIISENRSLSLPRKNKARVRNIILYRENVILRFRLYILLLLIFFYYNYSKQRCCCLHNSVYNELSKI